MSDRRWMGLFPKTSRDLQCIDLQVLPPVLFVPSLVQLPMMAAAQRHGELITYLKPNGPGLRKPQVMRIAGLPAADQARLRSDEFQVCLVAQSFGFGNRELALVDFGRSQFGCGGR